MSYVLDACSVIAFFRNEPGSKVVQEVLENEICYIHFLNVCEIYYDFVKMGGEDVAENVLKDLDKYGTLVRDDNDPSLWKHAGRIKAELKRLSLADCFALALAHRLDATVLTSDHAEFDREEVNSICNIRFIR